MHKKLQLETAADDRSVIQTRKIKHSVGIHLAFSHISGSVIMLSSVQHVNTCRTDNIHISLIVS